MFIFKPKSQDMQFELTKEMLDDLRQYIASGQDSRIIPFIDDLHAADIAELFDELKLHEALYLYKLIDDEKSADILVELEDDVREKLLDSLTSREIADLVEEFESDEAADVIAELPLEKKSEVISLIRDHNQVLELVDLMAHPDDTAGAIMAKELIKVRNDWSVSNAFREIVKQAADIDEVYSVYVVDDEDRLMGTLSLRKLLLHSKNRQTKIEQIYNRKDLIVVKVDDPTDEVALLMQKYDLVVVPVIDEQGHLLGRITIDDVVDIVTEEAEKDYQMASGISENIESDDALFTQLRGRLPWILIGMFGGLLASQVIAKFEAQLSVIPAMALFIPLIIGTGGNVGVQSAAIVVQGLANNTLKLDNLIGKLLRELSVGLINGLICAVLLYVYAYFIGFDFELANTISFALFIVIIFSSLFGTFIPIFLNSIKIDPAFATGPFITTANDVIGLFIYFAVGHMMYTL
jgi:magnesium transporter